MEKNTTVIITLTPSPLYYLFAWLELVMASLIAQVNYVLIEKLFTKVKKESEKLNQVMTQIINGFIPICANCKSIRQQDGTWIQIEKYISSKSNDAKFTHGVCPACEKKFYGDSI